MLFRRSENLFIQVDVLFLSEKKKPRGEVRQEKKQKQKRINKKK